MRVLPAAESNCREAGRGEDLAGNSVTVNVSECTSASKLDGNGQIDAFGHKHGSDWTDAFGHMDGLDWIDAFGHMDGLDQIAESAG